MKQKFTLIAMLIFLFASTNVLSQKGEGSVCTDPIVVDAFPFQDLGQTTCGMGNNYSSTCLVNYDTGEDIHYQFTLTEEQIVTITMDPNGTGWTGMLLTDQCPPPGADCIATSIGSSGIRVIEETLEAGTYFIMISTWPSPPCIPNFDLTITTEDPPPYCLGGPTSLIDSNVERVLISGENDTEIDHTGCPGVLGVEDLTHLLVDLYRGETYTLEVTFGTCGTSNWPGAGSVWVDWDQDFVFDPADLIYENAGTPGTPTWEQPVTISFTVPATAELGNTVMRVMQWEDSSSFPAVLPLNPCATFSWGSVMDFGINVIDAVEEIIAPFDLAITTESLPIGNALFTWDHPEISNKDSTRDFTGFDVFLDGNPVETGLSDGEHLFEGLAAGSYTAGVRSVYDDGTSDIITLDFDILDEDEDDDDEPPFVDLPLTNWALYLTILLIGVFVIIRFRRMI